MVCTSLDTEEYSPHLVTFFHAAEPINHAQQIARHEWLISLVGIPTDWLQVDKTIREMLQSCKR